MEVFKVAELSHNTMYPLKSAGRERWHVFAGIVTSLVNVPDFAPECSWGITIVVDRGPNAREVKLNTRHFMSRSDLAKSNTEPVFITEASSLIFFRNGFYMTGRPINTQDEMEEVILRVKKIAFDDESEISTLRNQIANIESAIEFSHSKTARQAIPEDVKLVVWARDKGVCVYCGSKVNLQFDHTIPVAKGGGNSPENVQILCRECNLRKSDKISI
ncbi:MAG: HNH endonuclease [Bacteroidetes bacterium]|nr:HNH endonuclease [Bacteroidota bacterium]MCL5739234.1 HNH endonuclease [Bacteroidota bacterium]